MAHSKWWLVLGILSLTVTQAYAEVYRWTDANGRVIYGDNPPEQAKTQPLELPPLTISDGMKPKVESRAESKPTEAETDKAQEKHEYQSFTITNPVKDEGLRANDGATTINLAIKPEKLFPGDTVLVYINGKQIADGVELTYPVKELERGTHTTFAVIKNIKGDIIANTEVTTFHVLKAKKKDSI